MESDNGLSLAHVPDLNQPVLIAAFAGWNDASQVATHAVSALIPKKRDRPFATIDPENYFDFTETRPVISLGAHLQRSLSWPQNAFYARKNNGKGSDLALLLGTEPQLKWRTFCATVLSVAQTIEASRLITLGGLLADVPHTVAARLTGFGNPPELLKDLREMGVRMSSYEGPTGVVGALHDAWSGTGLPAASIWANVPHYISAAPNFELSLALVRCVRTLTGQEMRLDSLEKQAAAFRLRVDEALQDNPEALQYVRQLEEQQSQERALEASPELIDELEEFLRNTRPPDEQ